ncbi:MAG: hypothetical protein MNPFHGCM_02219 [Gemmatimonadaceae bacterium]|nr:hypothetical protein [Gemmatimonadaceae bacterium]
MVSYSSVAVGLAIAGVGAALVSAVVPGRPMQAVGIAALGLAGIAMAASGIATRTQIVPNPEARYARYEGAAALWGSVWLALLGAAVVVLAVAWASHAELSLFRLAAKRPGLLLAPFGASMLSSGVANKLGWRLQNHPERLHIRSPVGGAAAIAGGTLLLVAGLVELGFPDRFDAGVGAVVSGLLTHLGGRTPTLP